MNDIKETSFKLLSRAFLAKCLCTEYQVVWFGTVGNIKLNYIKSGHFYFKRLSQNELLQFWNVKTLVLKSSFI